MTQFVRAHNRCLVSINGPDGHAFLQGLITNDINLVSPQRSIYAALLTPQGKFLYDFFIFHAAEGYLLDIASDRVDEFVKILNRYKLRSQVRVEKYDADVPIYFVFGNDVKENLGFTRQEENATLMVDPRLKAMGWRFYGKKPDGKEVLKEDFETHRLKLGVPEAGIDLLVEKSIPLECGLDDLHAVAWDKGCYMGQELTARTKHRGLVRKRLLSITFDGGELPQNSLVFKEDAEVGKVRSTFGGFGIAMIRLEALEGSNVLRVGEHEIQAHIMPWMKIAP